MDVGTSTDDIMSDDINSDSTSVAPSNSHSPPKIARLSSKDSISYADKSTDTIGCVTTVDAATQTTKSYLLKVRPLSDLPTLSDVESLLGDYCPEGVNQSDFDDLQAEIPNCPSSEDDIERQLVICTRPSSPSCLASGIPPLPVLINARHPAPEASPEIPIAATSLTVPLESENESTNIFANAQPPTGRTELKSINEEQTEGTEPGAEAPNIPNANSNESTNDTPSGVAEEKSTGLIKGNLPTSTQATTRKSGAEATVTSEEEYIASSGVTQRPPTPESSGVTQRPPTPESSGVTQRPPTPEFSGVTQRPPTPESSGVTQRPPTPESSGVTQRPPPPEFSGVTQRPPTPESNLEGNNADGENQEELTRPQNFTIPAQSRPGSMSDKVPSVRGEGLELPQGVFALANNPSTPVDAEHLAKQRQLFEPISVVGHAHTSESTEPRHVPERSTTVSIPQPSLIPEKDVIGKKVKTNEEIVPPRSEGSAPTFTMRNYFGRDAKGSQKSQQVVMDNVFGEIRYIPPIGNTTQTARPVVYVQNVFDNEKSPAQNATRDRERSGHA